MKELRIIVVLHLVLGPFGVWIMAEDARHPERWDTWYRNPAIAIPYCLAMEGVIWGVLLLGWLRERRFSKAKRLMEQANRLLAEGQIGEADAAYDEGRRILEGKS